MGLHHTIDDDAHVVTCSFTLRIVEIVLDGCFNVQDVVSISPVNFGAVLISGILH